MRAAGGLCRQVPADAAASQLGKASRSALPLLPGDGAQPPPGPLINGGSAEGSDQSAWPHGQVPGLSHLAGVGRVVAPALGEGARSMPPTNAVTRHA